MMKCHINICFQFQHVPLHLGVMPLYNVGIFLALRAALPASAVPVSPAFWLTFLIEGRDSWIVLATS